MKEPSIIVSLADLHRISVAHMGEAVEEEGDYYYLPTEDFENWYLNRQPVAIEKGVIIFEHKSYKKSDREYLDSVAPDGTNEGDLVDEPHALIAMDEDANVEPLVMRFDFTNMKSPKFMRCNSRGEVVTSCRLNTLNNTDLSEFDIVIKNHKDLDADSTMQLAIMASGKIRSVERLDEISHQIEAMNMELDALRSQGLNDKVDKLSKKINKDANSYIKAHQTFAMEQAVRMVYLVMYHMSKYKPKIYTRGKNIELDIKESEKFDKVLKECEYKYNGVVGLETNEIVYIRTPKSMKNYQRHTDAWYTRGHWRTLKSGRRVWVKGHVKGDADKLQQRIYSDSDPDDMSIVEHVTEVQREIKVSKEEPQGVVKPHTPEKSEEIKEEPQEKVEIADGEEKPGLFKSILKFFKIAG